MSKTDAPPPAEAPPLPESQPGSESPGGLKILCPNCEAPLRPGAKFCDKCGAQLASQANGPRGYGFGAEAWLSIGIGILLLFFVPNTLKYASSKIFHTHFAPFTDLETNERVDYISYMDGSKTSYRNTVNYFWNDLALTTFALALVVEGVALVLSRKPLVIILALVLTVSATLFNLFYFLGTFNTYGLAPLSAIAVIFGGYMVIFQLGLLQATRYPKPA